MKLEELYIPNEDETKLPTEKNILTIGIYGNCDYLDLKGIVENVVDGLGIAKAKYVRESENPSYHPGKTAALMVRNKKAGVFGEVHPDVTENYGIDVDCYVAELRFRCFI